MKCADSNWNVHFSSLVSPSSSASARYMRMTSSDFSLRLCAFSTLSGRTSKTISGSTTRIAGTKSAFSLSRTARRWLPLGVQ